MIQIDRQLTTANQQLVMLYTIDHLQARKIASQTILVPAEQSHGITIEMLAERLVKN